MNRRGFIGKLAAAFGATLAMCGCPWATKTTAPPKPPDPPAKPSAGIASRKLFMCGASVEDTAGTVHVASHDTQDEAHACAILNLKMRDDGQTREESAIVLHPHLAEALPSGRWIGVYDTIDWPVFGKWERETLG